MEGKGFFMDRKNRWVAVLLPFLLVFCGAWGMDRPQVHEKKEICAALQKTAVELRNTETRHDFEAGKSFRQQLTEQLSLLSNKFPHRKNKIDVLIKDLTQPISSNYDGILTQALEEICADKKSVIEQAQETLSETLSIPEKLRRLELLYTHAQSKKSTQRLLKLLWEQDIKDLEAIRIALLSEQTKILGEKLEQNAQWTPLKVFVFKIEELKKEMYDINRRASNIYILSNAKKELKNFDSPERKQLIQNYRVKIRYMLAILKMWKAFDEGIMLELGDFATTILSIEAYVLADFLNNADIKKIQELIKNPMFTNFIDKRFDALDESTQGIVLKACKKIREKKGLENFPVPIEQAQTLSESPVQAIAEQQNVPLASVVPEAHLTSEQIGETPRIDIKKRPELVALFRGWPQARPRDTAAEQPVRQSDGAEPQDFWTRVSIALSELKNILSEGFFRIWRSVFG